MAYYCDLGDHAAVAKPLYTRIVDGIRKLACPDCARKEGVVA